MRPEFAPAWLRMSPALTTIFALAAILFAATYAFAAPPQMSVADAMAAAEKGEIVLIDIRAGPTNGRIPASARAPFPLICAAPTLRRQW